MLWLRVRRPNGEQLREQHVPSTCDVRAGGDGGWKGRRLNSRCALKGASLVSDRNSMGPPSPWICRHMARYGHGGERNVDGDLASLAGDPDENLPQE